MGRARAEDLPANNAVTAQIEVHQGALAQSPDGVLGRLSERMGGPAHRALRMAFVEWVRQSVVPGMQPEMSKLQGELRKIAELGELQDMRSLWSKSMEDYWQGQGAQGEARGVAQGVERARADERALLCRQAGRKFGERAAERLSAVIDGVTDRERLAEVGDRIIDCRTQAEFLARLRP